TSRRRAACKTMGRVVVWVGCAKTLAERRSRRPKLESSRMLRTRRCGPGAFEDLLDLGLVLLEQVLVCGFEAHDQHRLRVGGAQQTPAILKDDTDPVDVDG